MAKFREIIVKSIDVKSGSYLSIADETKNITALDIYLVPKQGGEHERYVVDNNGLISKQSVGGNGNFIPMAGINLENDKITGALYQGNIKFNNSLSSNGDYKIYKGGPMDGNIENSSVRTINSTYNFPSTNFVMDVNDALSYYGKMLNVTSTPTESSSEYSFVSREISGFLRVPNYYVKVVHQTDDYNYRVGSFQINHQIWLNYRTQSRDTTIILGENGMQFTGLNNADGDPTFTKQIVVKDDGTLGIKPILGGTTANYIPLTGTEPNKPLTGVIEINNDRTYFGGMKKTSSMGLGTKEVTFFGDEQIIIADESADRTHTGRLTVNQDLILSSMSWNDSGTNNMNTSISQTRELIQFSCGQMIQGIPQAEKLLELSGEGIKTNALIDAQDDPTYTRQLVQKEDGTIGYFNLFDQYDKFQGNGLGEESETIIRKNASHGDISYMHLKGVVTIPANSFISFRFYQGNVDVGNQEITIFNTSSFTFIKLYVVSNPDGETRIYNVGDTVSINLNHVLVGVLNNYTA